MDVNTAIRNGDADALRKLLAEKPSRANELIHWGKCRTHPLHYVSDMLFEGALQKGKELPLIDALIRACGPQLRARREARNAAYRSRESRSRGCRAQAPGCWSETGSAWALQGDCPSLGGSVKSSAFWSPPEQSLSLSGWNPKRYAPIRGRSRRCRPERESKERGSRIGRGVF